MSDKAELNELLQKVAVGELSPEAAALELRMKPIREVGEYAKVDMHRGIRQGVPEVIYGAGKTAEQIAAIARTMQEHGQRTILITRMDEDKAEIVRGSLFEEEKSSEKVCSDGNMDNTKGRPDFLYSREARCAIIGPIPKASGNGKIVVATGGTSDIPVAEEAAATPPGRSKKANTSPMSPTR